MKTMIIIGGGAAGLMTAIHAAEHYSVTVLEKNEKTGKKLYITGKGRCNLTNNCTPEHFLTQVVSNPRFLYPAILSYPPERVMGDFSSWGLRMKTERGNRVFPVSDHSSDVIRVLTDEVKRRGGTILLHKEVREILTEAYNEGDDQKKRVTGVLLSDGSVLSADVVVLATGGVSYASTGSTGDGLRFLSDLGLAVTKLYPSLVPFETEEKVVRDYAGLGLKNIEAHLIVKKGITPKVKKDKELAKEFGELLFTHTGVSGPVILTASAHLASFMKQNGLSPDYRYKPGELTLSIDLKPAMTEEMLKNRLEREKDSLKDKELVTLIRGYLPKAMVDEFLRRAELKPERKTGSLSGEEIGRIISLFKDFRFSVTGTRGFGEAVITSGGLSTKEVDPKTMSVKKIDGLRAVGEVLDLDAMTGGYNLQIAWCTAYLAAHSSD